MSLPGERRSAGQAPSRELWSPAHPLLRVRSAPGGLTPKGIGHSPLSLAPALPGRQLSGRLDIRGHSPEDAGLRGNSGGTAPPPPL